MECFVSLNAICFVTRNGIKSIKGKREYLQDILYLLKLHTILHSN